MFFLLSKILDFLITPYFWIVLLLAIAAFSAKLRKRALMAAFILTLFFGNMFIVDEFVRAWELPLTQLEDLDDDYDVAIVLGGGVFYDAQYKRVNYSDNFHRYYDAAQLYKLGKVDKLLVSGGAGTLVNTEVKEAHQIRDLWLELGIPGEDIIIEATSRNTYENAVETKKVLDQHGINGKYLLVTSASHMRRSLGCFSKAGIKAVPYCTNKKTGPRKFYPDYLLIPTTAALGRWNMLMHEWYGCVIYWVMGYI